jgi:hypothetical protein
MICPILFNISPPVHRVVKLGVWSASKHTALTAELSTDKSIEFTRAVGKTLLV